MQETGLIPGLGRSAEEGTGYPLQYSYLENPMDRGAWWATVHGVARVGHDLVTTAPPPPPPPPRKRTVLAVIVLPAMRETWFRSLGLERSPGEGKVSSLQYSGLENSMDCIGHGITKSQTRLSDFHFHFHFSHTLTSGIDFFGITMDMEQ